MPHIFRVLSTVVNPKRKTSEAFWCEVNPEEETGPPALKDTARRGLIGMLQLEQARSVTVLALPKADEIL